MPPGRFLSEYLMDLTLRSFCPQKPLDIDNPSVVSVAVIHPLSHSPLAKPPPGHSAWTTRRPSPRRTGTTSHGMSQTRPIGANAYFYLRNCLRSQKQARAMFCGETQTFAGGSSTAWWGVGTSPQFSIAPEAKSGMATMSTFGNTGGEAGGPVGL